MFEVSDAYKTAIAKQSRRFKLGGEIRLKSGTVIDITDSNVIGELSISTQMMSGSQFDDTIDIGAITSAVLSMTIKDDSSANSFADARVRLLVGLELENGTYEYVKMGIFYIDSPSIKRVKNIISFTAYDKMIFLHYLLTDTMRSNMSGMDAYGAAGYLCSLVGIQLQQTHDEVAAFPNGDVALSFLSESLETARDVIMWCGQLMGCFTRITRSGKLEFVQIRATQDDNNMIIPVREIQSSQRFSTKFADEVLRISTLTMKKPDGNISRAYLTGTSGNKRSLELELEQNPLLTGQSVKSVGNALKDMLAVLKTAYFRPFTSEIANDPALDAGDYVRLRGGSIDTSRGYATGIITHSTWRYQGKQDLVNVGATPVLSQLEDDTSEATVAALSTEIDESEDSGDISGEEIVYTQPKPQSGKAASLYNSGGISSVPLTEYEYLTDLSAQCNGVTYTAEKDADTGLISKISDSNGNEFEPTINSGITDVTLHNAVFMAVAMIKGFESSTPIGAFAEFVPTGINLSELRWYNRIGEDYMKFSSKTPSTAMDSGDLVLKNWNQNLTYNCDDPATVYIIFKNTLSGYNLNTYGDQIPTFAPVLCRGGGIDIIYSFTTLICANDGLVCGLKKGGTPSNDVMLASTQSADSWHIGCLTRNDSNEISFYVDGSMVGTLCTYSTTQINEYTGYYAINARLSKNGILTNCYHENMYRYLAFCNVCHNSAQVLKYSGLLLNKYGK